MKKFLMAAVAAAAVAPAALAAAPAQAASAHGCPWPYVCFYTKAGFYAGTPSAMYKDVTSGYQTLSTRARGAWAVYNARNDDGARIGTNIGSVYCVRPNEVLLSGQFAPDPVAGKVIVTKIRIVDSPTC